MKTVRRIFAFAASALSACFPFSEWDDPATGLRQGQVVGDRIVNAEGLSAYEDHTFLRWEHKEAGIMHLRAPNGASIKLCRTGFETPQQWNRIHYGRC